MSRPSRTRTALAAAVLCAFAVPRAQEPRPAFEVSSVKPRTGPPQGVTSIVLPAGTRPGAFEHRNATVRQLVMYGYDLRDYQIEGGPEWTRGDRFDVSARAGSEVPVATMRLMVQSLLADRFKLAVHEVEREMSIYALVLARADGRPGPRLKKNEDNCQTKVEQPSVPGSRGAITSAGCGALSVLASSATLHLNAPVLDRTGLDGRYEWSYYYDGEGRFFGEPQGNAVAAIDTTLPRFPTALQEQLGLKLEPTKGTVKVLVIDSVQRPTEN